MREVLIRKIRKFRTKGSPIIMTQSEGYALGSFAELEIGWVTSRGSRSKTPGPTCLIITDIRAPSFSSRVACSSRQPLA